MSAMVMAGTRRWTRREVYYSRPSGLKYKKRRRSSFLRYLGAKPFVFGPWPLQIHIRVGTLAPNPRICAFELVGDGEKAKVLGNL